MKYLFSSLCITFCLLFIISTGHSQSNDPSYQQVDAFESYVHSLCKEVEESGNLVDNLTHKDLGRLPIGIARKVGNTQYIIAIDSAYRADRGGWFLSAYASITFPGSNEPIAFAAKDIGFNKGGLTSSSHVKLLLASTQKIDLSEHLQMVLPADGENFIEFDCDGFKAVNLKGNFVFSGDMLVPDTELARNSSQVTASFEINTSDLNNIMTSVSITPFKIKGLNDLSFEVNNAVADFSDIVNPAGFIFPQDYQQTYGADLTLWRGFYLQDLTVHVKGLGNETTGTKIQAKNLLIDDMGISGMFDAPNILSLEKGSADGWPFSVEHFSVQLMFNKIRGGGLKGKINIPFLGNEPIDYTAQMEQIGNELNYAFAIATNDAKEFSTPFGATIKIEKGSIIAMKKRDGTLVPSANLHGTMSVAQGAMTVEQIKFENLGLSTQKPYITSGDFSLVGDKQANSIGFPVRIDSVSLGVYQGQAALGFGVAINFMNKEDKPFGASTYVQLLAKMEEMEITSKATDGSAEVSKRQQWKFDKAKINDVTLDCRTQAFTLSGTLSVFDNDPTYGDGFHGNIQFSIKKVLAKGVKVNAYFGSKETFRYWHLDAFVPTGNIPIVPPIAINGFMGGASYKMVRQQPLLPDFSQLGDDTAGLATGNNHDMFVYIPDEKAGLGFLAGVTLVVANENAINADVMLEVAFNEGGGIRYAQFNGSAFFLTGIASRGRVNGNSVPKAPVYASLNMLFDNDNDVFHANMKTYISLAGVIEGVGPNGLVGEAVIHVDPKDWYTYIGRPTQMFGLNIAGIATAKTYFMMGTKIENLPAPPREVQEVFGKIDLRLMRDDLAAAGGRGIATGVHFKVGFDSENNLRPFYIAMAVGAGTDVMLRDYGDAQCVGRSGSIGIDGWYASGQAYVFLKGNVGIRVKRRNFDIVSLGLAALLQAKLPNPTWMKGQVAGKYKVMGGLVKGKFHLSFTIGDECEIINQGSEIDNIEVIADLMPEGTEVSVFTAPQVSFNTTINTDFSMMDLQNNLNSYRVKLDDLTITSENEKLQANITWNESKDVAILKTREILPPNTQLKVYAKVYWERKQGNGIWETMKDDKGQIIYEEKETSFTTGTAPNFIPEENVAYSYPIKYQHNLHVDETGQGYVKLDYGQEYLFVENEGDIQWEFVARFRDNRGKVSELPLRYNTSTTTVTFAFPADFEKQAIYNLTFVKRPKNQMTVDQNVHRSDVKVASEEDNEISIASTTLEGTITQSVEKDIYATAFRTSQFPRFKDKMAAISKTEDMFDVAKGYVAVIGKRLHTQETLDEFELHGKEGVQPLVQVIASPETRWFKNIISPALYDLYPHDKDVEIIWRDPAVLGVKPLKGVSLTSDMGKFQLTDLEVAAGRVAEKRGSMLIGYYLSYYAFWDYKDLQNKASEKYLDNWKSRPEGIRRLLAITGYTDLLEGQYPVDITYTLPGINEVTYKDRISIKF